MYLSHKLKSPIFKPLAVFYFFNILVIFLALKINSKRTHRVEVQNQDLREKINILEDANKKEIKNKSHLQGKIGRYDSLKEITERINRDLQPDSIAKSLTEIVFSLIANNKGACILYSIDSVTQKPVIFKTKKEDKRLIIKAKEGDVFDLWVLRHATPLFIEDIRKDFRFDLEKIKVQDERVVSSLISAPLISEKRFLGILRLDSTSAEAYSQDDLRLLVTVCDLGAVALENAELFQRTQNLAIHDELTGLYTKGYFLERLREECKRSIRQNSPLSLFMLDIDYFKDYNDKFGHTAGDIVLKNLSANITGSLKNLNVIISRFGGEEFCVILSGVDKIKASLIAESLRREVEKSKIVLRRQETSITVSIGVATFPLDASDENEIIIKADKAMYEAKKKGRNKVVTI